MPDGDGTFPQVAAIGLPDQVRRPEGPRHRVVVNPEGVDTALILRLAADQLPAYMVPRAVELVEDDQRQS